MKKLLLSVLSLCMGAMSPVCAETTDISAYANVIYIEPLSVHAGSLHTLSVKMKNSVSAEGFEFYLYLPDGISFNGDPGLSEERTTAAKTNSFNFTIDTDGALHVFAASTVGDAVISGNDGEVALVPILVDENVTPGEYTLTIKKGVVSGSDAQSYGPDESVEVNTTINITEPLANTILDENSTTAPEASVGAVNVTVNRTIKANEWSTICLPFDMTAAQVTSAFGNDVLLKRLSSWSFTGSTNAAEGITMGFTTATIIEKNYPCLIKVTSNISSFDVDGVEIDPVAEEDLSSPGVGYKVGKKTYVASLYGTYRRKTTDEKDMFLANNKFWYSDGSTVIKGFRAVFYFDGVVLDSYNGGGSAHVTMILDDEATGIGNVVYQMSDETCYNLNGQRVTTPGKGLYIHNGKKVIIK